MEGVSVGITENSNSLDSQLLGSSHDAASNLTTIWNIREIKQCWVSQPSLGSPIWFSALSSVGTLLITRVGKWVITGWQ